MSISQAPEPPACFALSAEEAKAAASRAGLRAALSGRLFRAHLAPLIIFAVVVVFAAILGATGLLARRLAEAALILAAIAFMATRMIEHWRMRGARNRSFAAADALQRAGAATIRLDARALHVETATGSRAFEFADCDEAEETGGLIFLWPRHGEPAVIPARAFASAEAAGQFLSYLRGAAKRRG